MNQQTERCSPQSQSASVHRQPYEFLSDTFVALGIEIIMDGIDPTLNIMGGDPNLKFQHYLGGGGFGRVFSVFSLI
jgi:hypothetical protein